MVVAWPDRLRGPRAGSLYVSSFTTPPRRSIVESESDSVEYAEDPPVKTYHPLPALLRRRSTRRISVYTAHHVMLVTNFRKHTFAIVWMTMLGIRLWCIVFLGWTARLYWFVAHPYMRYYAALIGPSAVANFKPMGIVFGMVAAMHTFQVATMIRYSLHYRELVLGPPPHSLGPDGNSLCFRDWHSRFRSRRVFYHTFKRDFIRLFFDRHGPFGVESPFFDLRFLLREVIGIVSQTTQVYNASILVSKVWLNNLYVGVTVLNAWSTPLIRFAFYKLSHVNNIAWERVVCLCADFLLDAVSAMLIPMLLLVPYYEKFDFTVYNFELVYLYDDTWFANMVMENQQLFARNGWDFLWKMIPHLSIYFTLNSICALVRPYHQPTRIHCSDLPPSVKPLAPSPVLKTIQATDEQSSFEEAESNPPNTRIINLSEVKGSKPPIRVVRMIKLPAIPEAKRLRQLSKGAISRHLSFLNPQTRPLYVSDHRRRLQHIVILILFLAGSVILGLHVHAAWHAFTTPIISCTTRSRPWFTSQASCLVVRHNCHMHGTIEVTNDDLAMIAPESIAALVFTHCPQMRVPTIVATFRNLLGIDFYNCTMYEWSIDAAITAERHPRLTYIILVYVNMTALPDGILQPLPPTMTDFEVVRSNLTTLPWNLDTLWHPMALFYVEHSLLTEFPPALTRLHVDDLSLIGNAIERLPEFASNVSFVSLAMTHTPLVELPNSVGDTKTIGFLDLGYTQLQSFPPWMDDVVQTATKIFAHNTPFCASKSDEEITDQYGPTAVLSCDGADDVRQNGKYPLDILAQHRRYFDPDMVLTTSSTGPSSTSDP